MATLKSINPSNYKVLGEIESSSIHEVQGTVWAAHRSKVAWRDLGVAGRVKLLRLAIEEFVTRKDEFALLESREMGMPINETRVDYQGTLDFANWYLDNAEKYLGPETTFESETEIHRVSREPIGVAAVIIPWNYPFLNFIWGTFQSLIAGNTVVMKHSEETPLCGKLIEEIMTRHLPPGVFGEVYGDGCVGRVLVEQDINLLGFVGSTKTGKTLYQAAGNKLIKAVMELGGSAPGIVFDDADIDAAVKSICEFRLTNCGQYCDGLKRLIVHDSVFDTVIHKLSAAFSAKGVGVAEDETTELGPLVSKRQLGVLASQVHYARNEGAVAVTGGHMLEAELGGAFFEPTLLVNVNGTMRVWREEVFGPVLPVMSFRADKEAVDLANNTAYGLGSYVYTTDKDRAARVADKLDTRMVSINGTNYTTPFNPFGGCKNSGIGCEHGKYGFHELTQTKVVARNK